MNQTQNGTTPVLEVRDLGIDFWVEGEWVSAARDISYTLYPGDVLAIVGESGSGKSTSSMGVLGLLPGNGRATGSAKLSGDELIGASAPKLRKVRGKGISVIFQEPMTALNPVYTVGYQIVEALQIHNPSMRKTEATERAIELLTQVEMPNPKKAFDSFPHQLSGGQRQRAMIAQSMSNDPKLLIADEPTTALDVTVQAEILDLMRRLHTELDSAIVLITHDMGVVADLADQVIVMKDGAVVEHGKVNDIFTDAQHPYTKALLESVPHLGVTSAPEDEPQRRIDTENVLHMRDLVIEYPKRGRVPAFRAVDGADLDIKRGEVVGLVGESGSGKTTIGRAAIGLLPVHSGTLEIAGQPMAGVSKADLRAVRQNIGIVFQDPGSSLNPRIPIGESIAEPLVLAGEHDKKQINARVEELLAAVELPRMMRNRYPHELSGGQRQRVGIARALALKPKLLVADEPTSALDVSVQARVLDLFRDLQRDLGFGCLFVTHDLAVVDQLADRIAVMHNGKLVEQGTRDQILRNPQDPYTQRLIAAVPVPDPTEQRERRQLRDAAKKQAPDQ